MGFGIGEAGIALGILATLVKATQALWKIANDDGQFKANVSTTLASMQETQEKVFKLVDDHETRLRVIERTAPPRRDY